MLNDVRTILGAIKTNYSGDSIKEKILIIESDDWGAIRMPHSETLEKLRFQGIDLTQTQYAKDGLETNSDLEDLFNMLAKYKDSTGRHPIITANTIVANPNFKKIIESNFKEYHYSRLDKSIKDFSQSDNLIKLYNQGIDEGVYRPQFHGREHLNFRRWLKDITEGNKKAKLCLEHGFTSCGEGDYAYMEAFDWSEEKEIEEHKHIIADGLTVFEDIFGYRSKSFIPPCYTLDIKLEAELKKLGVSIIQGTRNHLQPTGRFENYKLFNRKFGSQNNGLIYSVRNVFFEPTIFPAEQSVEKAIKQISMAFLFNKPAVVCSHRINYSSRIDNANAKQGVLKLEQLIQLVLKKWPDVKFISTDELDNYFS